jgi:adenine/guanine phosphoribosyltransferase-like PRPP-binding protein
MRARAILEVETTRTGKFVSAVLTRASQEELLEAFPPIHPNVYAHHATLAFKPSEPALDRYVPYLGERLYLSVIGYAEDDKGQAVVVDAQSENRVPHVTISTADGVGPVYSNRLLEQGYEPIDGPELEALVDIEDLGEAVLELDPQGGLRRTPEPKKPGSIWTHRRRSPEGNPMPYRRIRKLSSGNEVEILAAYHKQNAPLALLRQAKNYGPLVGKMAREGADDIAIALESHGITEVVPVPSRSPMAARFAALLASRLGVPVRDRLQRDYPIGHVPIHLRKAVAQRTISATGRPRRPLVVDEYVTTGATLMAAAEALYRQGAVQVTAAAFAI